MMSEFEQYRPLLFSIAYRMLGSAMEAEDIVQEAYLRYQSAQDVQTPKAYLTTIVTRLCLNQLQSARVQREQYLGTWLPEPILTGDTVDASTPSARMDRQEAISMAFLVLLEALTPPERAVLLLHEVFDYSYHEIAAILEREEADCRQLYSRAKKHLADRRPRFPSSPEQHGKMLERFRHAIEEGTVEELTTMLAHDSVLWADGKGRIGANTRPIYGQTAIALFLHSSLRFLPPHASTQVEEVNGEPALIIRSAGEPFVVIFVEVTDGQIQAIRAIGNPDKLKHI